MIGTAQEFFHKNGNRVPALVGGALVDDERGRAVCFVLDMSDLKRAEAALRGLNAELEARITERTDDLEAFTYSVSHDLRAPLRAMTGFANLLINEAATSLSDHHRHYLDRIVSNASRMGTLIDDLLTFSHLGRRPLRISKVSPQVLIERILDDLKPDCDGRDVQVSFDGLPACQGDGDLLGLVFQNLLANAVKFTREQPQARIEVSGSAALGEVSYVVADNGVGFDPAYADKLFHVFQRLHSAEQFEGTGVGLAIADRVIRRHGGTIWAESAPGMGARFGFTVPEAPNV